MSRIYLLLSLMLLPWIASAGNGNEDAKDKWYELIRYAGISAEDMNHTCAHFPDMDKYSAEKKNMDDFTRKRSAWMEKYPNEVQAFLSLPRIQKLNPSLVDLGLKKEGQEILRFEHPYWNWVQASKFTDDEMKTVAAHFPKPLNSGNIAADEVIYESAIQDWMRLFPGEMKDLLTHPKMVATSHGASKEFKIYSPEGSEAFLVLKLANNYKPERDQYQSGNPELDQVRYDMYLKRWFYEYDRMEFYRVYKPEQFEDYKKSIESQAGKPELGH